MGGAGEQNVTLARVSREGSSALEFGPRLIVSAELHQKIASDRRQVMVRLE